jgi:hypothetical protein
MEGGVGGGEAQGVADPPPPLSKKTISGLLKDCCYLVILCVSLSVWKRNVKSIKKTQPGKEADHIITYIYLIVRINTETWLISALNRGICFIVRL